MQVVKRAFHRSKYMRWLVIQKKVGYRDGHIRYTSRGGVVEKPVVPVDTKDTAYRLSDEDVDIINRAFELLEPIMEGVSPMPSLEVWRKLNGGN